MPRLTKALPKYRKHRASGQAVVTISGRDVYLGPHGTQVSKREYDRVVSEWLATGRPSHPPAECSELTLVELMAAYLRYAKVRYVKNGQPTSEQDGIRSALRPLKDPYGRQPAVEFGPLALKTVRHQMVQADLARSTINQNIGRIRRMFRWAASEELVPACVHQALSTVTGLSKGHTEARETAAVPPVSDDHVEAALRFMPSVVADMVRLQRLTGMRPGEVCILRPRDIDRTGDVWRYRPESHKTEHHDRERTIWIGPKAQEVLKPYLLRPAETCSFSPRDSERSRNADRRANRHSPMTPSQAARRRKRKRSRPPGDGYAPGSYRTAVRRACQKAGIPVWKPNQLRHTAATEIRSRFGLEAAQVTLGHATADVTQVYAERDSALAERIAREVG